jgi:hypothetical protein
MMKGGENVNNEEGGNKERRLNNEMKREAGRPTRPKRICDEIMKFPRRGHYVLMHRKTKELG